MFMEKALPILHDGIMMALFGSKPFGFLPNNATMEPTS